MHLQEQFDLQQLFTFYVAAGSRTFTEAAERLHVSQSAVSHSIRKLERSVGFRLIVRDHAPIRLTESGRLLFETCGRVFSDIGRCRDAIHQSDPKTLAGRLMVGATVEFGNSVLASGIAPFINKHPNIEIGFTFSHELLKLLRADELDLIIDCRVHTRQDLSRTVLFREKYVLVAAPKLMKTANIDCLADLERVSWLSLDAEGNWWQRLLVQLPPKSELNPTRLIPVNHLRGLINMAVWGSASAWCRLTASRTSFGREG